jgi:hypothetical protein
MTDLSGLNFWMFWKPLEAIEEGGKHTKTTKNCLIEKRQKNQRGDNDFENCCNRNSFKPD